MNLTPEQRAELEGPISTYEESDSVEDRCIAAALRALLADLEEHKSEFAKLMQKHNALHINAHETRQQLAEAQADNAAMHSAAHQLAIEAECFYLDCKDMPVLSKWTDPMLDAIGAVQALRWRGDTAALDAAIAEAVEPYKHAVVAMGFCPRCEWRPCECEGQYDD